MGRLETVTDPRNGSTTYNYDPVGVVTSMVQPNGISTLYEYDLRYRVTGIQSTFVGFQYSYDAAGNRTASTEMVNGVVNTLAWTYDAANRLTSTPALGATTSYTYDGRGNRISATNGTNVTTLSYDALDRLISVSLPTGMTAGYRYDADGRRVETLLDGQVTRYLWDEASVYGDVILETDGDGDVLASYVLGGMNILSQTREGDTSYYTQDALGSTRALTDAAGNLTDSYSYNAFGELFSQTGDTTNSHLFTGQQYDTTTGLYSMRARYYDPSVGRFLTRDTWGIDFENPVELNRYVYVANNPIRHTDPTGRFIDYGFKTKSSATEESAALRYAVGYLTRVEARERAIAFGLVATSILLAKLIELVEWLVLPQLQPQPAPTPDQPPAPAPAPTPEFDPSSDPNQDRENRRRIHIALGLESDNQRRPLLFRFTFNLNARLNPENIYVFNFGSWLSEGIVTDQGSFISFYFDEAFREAATNAERIHFNLEGINQDPIEYAERNGNRGSFAGISQGGYWTAVELYIIRAEGHCAKTTFWQDGSTNPIPDRTAWRHICT